MVLAAGTAESADLLVELGAVLIILAAAGRLARWVGLSPIPLYLLAGLAVGEGGVAELVTAREFIVVAAEIGVVLLLLMLGLEFSADELVGTMRASAPAGVVDLALNFTPGLVAGLLLGWSPTAAVLLGGITYISSSGIIAKLLEDLGRLGNRETPSILALLVLEDLAMAVYLPIVASLLIGGTVLAIAVEVLVALAAVAVALIAAVRWGGHFSRLVFSRSPEQALLSILGITLLVAGVAQHLQASAAVGAFLVGIALSGPAAQSTRQLLGPLRDLFAAIFFVFFGLELDPAAVPPVLPVALALAAVTAATKLATGWWAAGRDGVSRAGRLRAGAALVARGEFSIVVASLAVAEGVEAELGPVAAAYVLVIAVAGPVLARLADTVGHRLAPAP